MSKEPKKEVPARPVDLIIPGRREAITGATCVNCTGDASNFKDTLSAKEFTISGFCQACQDKFFGP